MCACEVKALWLPAVRGLPSISSQHTRSNIPSNTHTCNHILTGAAWLEAAAAAAVRGLPSADGHDLATLLEACNS